MSIIMKMEAFEEEFTDPQGEDIEVDIIEGTDNNIVPKTYENNEDPDATECSTSFGNTSDDFSGLSEGEVETNFFGIGNSDLASAFDNAFSSTPQMRRKKLTSSWRNFIRPLMWPCKWAELRIREIESQATRYSRELAVYRKRKNTEFDPHMLEEFGSKSIPFSRRSYRRKVMKRRKRKKVEDENDITSYMSHHNLFSYLENKKADPDGTSAAEDFSNPVKTEQNANYNEKFGISNDSILEFREADHSLEQVLRKIETVHSRLNRLKTQIDNVMSKNASKFSSSENLSLLAPCDGQTSSAPSAATFSAGNGENISVGAMYTTTSNQHLSEFDIGDLVLPESAISSFGEAVPVPDIIESTVGLLTCADVTFPQAQIGDMSEGIVDNVLIDNEMAETERHVFSREPENGKQEESTGLVLIPKLEPNDDKSTLKSCLASEVNFPRNNRKRGERKAGSGSWSIRHSSEHDNS